MRARAGLMYTPTLAVQRPRQKHECSTRAHLLFQLPDARALLGHNGLVFRLELAKSIFEGLSLGAKQRRLRGMRLH
jgi:hypothetical protein